MTPIIEIFGQKFAHFGGFEGSFLAIFEVKKVIFRTFSKLFWSCLGSVWALFSTLKGPLLGVFSARKVDKWPRKSRFFVEIFAFWEGDFDQFQGQKPVFWKWLARAACEVRAKRVQKAYVQRELNPKVSAQSARNCFHTKKNERYPTQTFSFGVPRKPYSEKNPQDFDLINWS